MTSCLSAEPRITDLVRRVFHAYQTADRSEIEPLLADDFTFTSPYDDHLDRAAYFDVTTAREKLNEAQGELVTRLVALLAGGT